MQNHLTKITQIYEGFYSMKALKNGKNFKKKEKTFKNFISTKGTYKKYREQTAINTNSLNKIHKNIWRVLLDRSNENGKKLQKRKGFLKV